jgi:hypothetical protein
MLIPFEKATSPEQQTAEREGDVAPILEDLEFVRPKFRIRDLMVATAIFAIYLTLAKAIGIFSLLISFICYLLAVLAVRKVPRWSTTGMQLSLDLMAGAFLPIGCLVFDPFIFRQPISRVVGFATIGSQICVLCSWMFVAPLLGPGAFSFASGFLAFGTVVAMLIGLMLIPFSIIGTLILIGLLGLIPFATAKTYYRHSEKARVSGSKGKRARPVRKELSEASASWV